MRCLKVRLVWIEINTALPDRSTEVDYTALILNAWCGV